MSSDGPSTALAPALPARALLVGPSVERAAALGPAFDEALTATPADAGAILAAEGAGLPCVAVTGLSGRGGRLGAVVAAVVAHCPPEVQVVVDLGDPVGAELGRDATPLRGLAPLDRVDVAGAACLRLVRAADPSATPDLGGLGELTGPAASARLAAAIEALVSTEEVDRLRERVAELEAEVSALTGTAAESAEALRAARAGARAAGGLLPRLLLGGGRKRIARLGMVAGTGAGAVAAVAVTLAWATDSGYEGALLHTLILLSLAQLLLTWRTSGRQAAAVRQVATAARRRAERQRKAMEVLRRRQALATKALTDVTQRVADLQRNLAVVTAATTDTAHAVTRLPAAVLDKIPTANNRASVQDVRQMQAVANLFAMLPVVDPMPLMGGWAASPDVVLLLVEELRIRRPRLVVECGSGASTLWLALAVRRWGLDTRIVALEHDAAFAQVTRDQVARNGVADIAEVRDAPLGPSGLAGHRPTWYDTAAIADLHDIGLLFVDGPPASTGLHARYPAVPLLAERLAPQVSIVLDDVVRTDEQEVVAAWEALLPGFRVARVPLEKGAAVLRRG